MPEQSEPFVIIDNVTKRFDGAQVLRDISAIIHPGEVLGLIGRSGSGKSVLINMLRGSPEYRPDSGSVIYRVNHCASCGWIDRPVPGEKCKRCGAATFIKEIDFWKLSERDPLRVAMRERIAIMMQRTFALYGDLTVVENIFEALGDKYSEKRKVERAVDLLKTVNLQHRITHIARDLSGGEKQRCVLARQLARDPLLLLADEPTGTLDPQTAEIVHKSLIFAVKNNGMTMVVTSPLAKGDQ